jgi:murein DD-endopeptidase MepM/ murein hydrolase activator NlpD
MIIPDRKGEKAYSICLSRTILMLVFAFLGTLVIAAVLLMFKSAEAAKKLHYFSAIQNENETLTKDNKQLRRMCQKIGRVDTFATYLENLSSISALPEKAKVPVKTSEARVHGNTADTGETVYGNRNGAEKDNNLKDINRNPAGGEASNLYRESIPTMLPVEGWITQQFIDDTAHGVVAHPGIDIAAAEGVIIKAPAAGTVLKVEMDQYYGNLIVIKHDNGFVTRYGHCAKVFIVKDEKVERGQTIALVGNTGHSTAPHLHYEVIKNGKNVNPLELIPAEKK